MSRSVTTLYWPNSDLAFLDQKKSVAYLVGWQVDDAVVVASLTTNENLLRTLPEFLQASTSVKYLSNFLLEGGKE